MDAILDVDTWHDRGRTVVELIGELDAYTVPRLREVLLDLDGRASHRLAIEMSGLDFMDSTGLVRVMPAFASLEEAFHWLDSLK